MVLSFYMKKCFFLAFIFIFEFQKINIKQTYRGAFYLNSQIFNSILFFLDIGRLKKNVSNVGSE